ncbi:hypothetical protein ANAEL_04476 [Anaerolineales bacterium]|nr:hypothetical protein ANAEL_04476 [Anaerolineales bacterium]
MKNPKALLIVGFFLIVAGVLLPFLMVIHILESTFFLNFFSFAAQVTGLFLGFIGSVMYIRVRR